MPSSSGPWFCSTLVSMRSPHSTLMRSNLLWGMWKGSVEGMYSGFQSKTKNVLLPNWCWDSREKTWSKFDNHQAVENDRRFRSWERVCTSSLPESLISEVNLVDRKGKPVGNTFGHGFFWTEIIDAAADTYIGVFFHPTPSMFFHLTDQTCSLFIGHKWLGLAFSFGVSAVSLCEVRAFC